MLIDCVAFLRSPVIELEGVAANISLVLDNYFPLLPQQVLFSTEKTLLGSLDMLGTVHVTMLTDNNLTTCLL